MRYKVLIEWNRITRRYSWTVRTNPDSTGLYDLPAWGNTRTLKGARRKVAVALQQLKAEHEEDLRNAGKRIEFEGGL